MKISLKTFRTLKYMVDIYNAAAKLTCYDTAPDVVGILDDISLKLQSGKFNKYWTEVDPKIGVIKINKDIVPDKHILKTGKAIKRPIPVKWFKWTGHETTLKKYMPQEDIQKYIVGIDRSNGTLMIQSLNGSEECKVGNIIIRGINGEYYPCDNRAFEKSYHIIK